MNSKFKYIADLEMNKIKLETDRTILVKNIEKNYIDDYKINKFFVAPRLLVKKGSKEKNAFTYGGRPFKEDVFMN